VELAKLPPSTAIRLMTFILASVGGIITVIDRLNDRKKIKGVFKSRG
jgi:hypothetical protein